MSLTLSCAGISPAAARSHQRLRRLRLTGSVATPARRWRRRRLRSFLVGFCSFDRIQKFDRPLHLAGGGRASLEAALIGRITPYVGHKAATESTSKPLLDYLQTDWEAEGYPVSITLQLDFLG